MANQETKAWKVTEKNTNLLHHISGVDERAYTTNIGWILVEDWSERPRFLIMPESVFARHYPNLELTTLKVDEEVTT